MNEYDPTRLMSGLTGRTDQLAPGMRVLTDDDCVCTVTEVTDRPVRNIRVVDSQGTARLLCIWQIVSTLPSGDVVAWADV